MNNAWVSHTALCPFYRCEDSYSVYCEGYVPDQYIRNCFLRPSLRSAYSGRYCRGSWSRCCFADEDARMRAADEDSL